MQLSASPLHIREGADSTPKSKRVYALNIIEGHDFRSVVLQSNAGIIDGKDTGTYILTKAL